MADEELRISLRTIAQTQGADQVRNSLRQVRQETIETELQNRRHAASIKTSELANRELAASLRGTALAARQAAQATRQEAVAATGSMLGLGGSFRSAASDAIRFAAALTGVQLGLSLASSAGGLIKDAFTSSVQAQVDAQRTARATAAAYGASADSFTRFSVSLSAQTGFTKNAILEAALSARTLSDNYGLTIQQTQKLISVSADLARVRGIGVAEAFERVQSAIRGEAEASEFLGLTLNATFLQQNAQNGSLRQTFTALTDVQRAQVVYGEVLRQTEKFQGLAAESAKGLEGSFSRLDNAVVTLKTHLGELLAPGAKGGADAFTGLVTAADDLITRVQTLQKLAATPIAFDTRPALVALADLATKLPLLVQPGGLSLKNITDSIGRLGQALILPAGAFRFSDQLADIKDRLEKLPLVRVSTDLNIFDERMRSADLSTNRWRRDLEELARATSDSSSLIEALGTSAETATTRAAEAAANDLRKVTAAQNALEIAARTSLRAQLEARSTTDPGSRHVDREALAQLATLDQLEAANRDLITLQGEQRDLQREQRDLAIQEAQATLDMLPQRQAIAALERQITDQVNQRLRLQQEAAHIAAEQRAAPAQNALEDTQSAVARARLVLADRRNQSPEDRLEARQTIRGATRGGTLASQELAAFDANQGISAVERAQRATDLATRAAQNPLQQQLVGAQSALRPGLDNLTLLQQQGERLDQLARIGSAAIDRQAEIRDAIINAAIAAAARDKEPVQVHIVVQNEAGDVILDQMHEAVGAAQMPTVIKLSGVR